MRKIGIFLGIAPNAGGMFQYAESLLDAIKEIQSADYEVHVAFVSSSWKSILENYPFQKTNLKCGKWGLRLANLLMAAQIPSWLTRFISAIFNPIPKQLAQLRCDFWIFPGQDALSYQVNLPVVATIHDLMHRYESSFPEVSKGYRWKIREHRYRNLASWARAILVDSEIGKKHVVESYGTSLNKIFVLPYVPPSHIIKEQRPEDFDKHYNLPKKFIFYPAQFWSHKNHLRLINAAASLRNRLPDISLVFTGMKNHEYGTVLQHVNNLGMADRVFFIGYVPDEDLVGFYKKAHAMMMPTFFGPTNIPPLEAFACGCPVAVSGIYGMPEQVGDAALLFNPTSESEIAKTMEKLWTNEELRRQLIEKGRQKSATWGPKQFAKKLQDILMQVEQLK